MAKKFIKNKILLDLGFNQVDKKTQTEDGILYDWFVFTKNDVKIEVGKEYGYQGKCVLQMLFFNDVQLMGFSGLSDVNNLIGLV